VLLNKADKAQEIQVRDFLEPGEWLDAFDGHALRVADRLDAIVPAHGVQVFILNQALKRADTRARLAQLMAGKGS
jgi:cyclomaltodextrin glucanotransferase